MITSEISHRFGRVQLKNSFFFFFCLVFLLRLGKGVFVFLFVWGFFYAQKYRECFLKIVPALLPSGLWLG